MDEVIQEEISVVHYILDLNQVFNGDQTQKYCVSEKTICVF